MNGARLSCAIVFMALLSGSAAAQGRGHGAPASPPPPALPPSAPSTVVGSPSTVMPLTPNDRPDVFQARPSTYAPRFDHVTPTRPLRGAIGAGVVLPYGPYGPFGPGTSPGEAAPGYLQVEVQPATAQVYVDGLLIGRADDLHRTGQSRALDAGAHHVDVRADGYEPASADVRIDPRETTVYRIELKSLAPAAPAAQVQPASPKMIYVISGCYAGTTPPRNEQLPNGCDPHNVRTVPPVVTRVDRQ